MDPSGGDVLRALRTILNSLLDRHVTTTIRVGAPRQRSSATPTGGTMADPVHLQQQQEFDCAITGVKDAQGRDASFDGIPVWDVGGPDSIVDVRVAPDGLSAIVGSMDEDGAATITVTADARMGPDVVPVMAVLSVIVAPSDVAVFDFVAGEARDRVG